MQPCIVAANKNKRCAPPLCLTCGGKHPNSNISISYFLELPDSKYSTEFIDTETNSIFQSNVEEGDVIIFPSHIIHRSPLITDSNVRKTTIAINLNLGDVNTNLINPIDPIFEGTINEKNTN